MRFLFGLITGAIITLLVATAMNAPTGPIVKQLTDAWQQATARVREAAAQDSPTLAPETSVAALPTPDAAAAAAVDRSDEALAAEPITPEPITPEPMIVEPARIETLPSPQPDAAPFADGVLDPAEPAAPIQTASAAQAAVAAEDVVPPEEGISLADVLASEGIVVEQSQPLNHAPLASQAVVWAPFHSEASAQGFASRLSRQLDRPFHVKKQSAANYLVVYEYADDAERSALEQQIAYATGQVSP